jgi:hypothetical protein
MNFTAISVIVGEAVALIATITPAIVWIRKIIEAQKCQLRSEMLRIYYRNQDKKTIRQYEYENFVFLYEAYRALRGNSFIEKIYNELKTWTIIP